MIVAVLPPSHKNICIKIVKFTITNNIIKGRNSRGILIHKVFSLKLIIPLQRYSAISEK